MNDLVRRRPAARVAFLGHDGKVRLVGPETLISVDTVKSCAAPIGTFQVVFAPTVAPGNLHAGSGQVTAEGAVDHWLQYLRPMTMVFVAMGSDATLSVVDRVFQRAAAQGGSLLSPGVLADATTKVVVQQALIMTGFIDSATEVFSMTPAGPQRAIQVSGSDLGKLLSADNVQSVYPAAVDVADRTIRPGLVMVGHKQTTPNSSGVTQDDANSLANRLSPVSATGFLGEILNGQSLIRVDEFVSTLLSNMPSLRVKLANGQWVEDFLPRPSLDTELALFSVFPGRFLPFSGSLWQVLEQVAPRPFAEFFVDTVGFGAELVIRRPPFARPRMMQSSGSVTQKMLTTLLNGVAAPAQPDLFTGDAFVSTPLRVANTGNGECYHPVGNAEVIDLQVSRADADAITSYQVLHSDLAGADPASLVSVFPLLVDVPAMRQFGSRPVQWAIPWWQDVSPLLTNGGTSRSLQPDLGQGTLPDVFGGVSGATDTRQQLTYEVAGRECVRAYYYFRDNAEYKAGAVALRGRPEIRIGDRVYFKDRADDLIAYVEQVQQSWAFGQPYVTRLQISRGQPLRATKRLAPYDMDPPEGLV